jgi:hypothetical protein
VHAKAVGDNCRLAVAGLLTLTSHIKCRQGSTGEQERCSLCENEGWAGDDVHLGGGVAGRKGGVACAESGQSNDVQGSVKCCMHA